MDEGAKEAFCDVLWRSNGGPCDGTGKPLVNEGTRPRGLCTRPHDCSTCPLMQATLSVTPGCKLWVCHECLKDILAPYKAVNRYPHATGPLVPGFYTEGFCQNPQCWALLQGQPQPKWSILLQLIILP